MIVRGTTITTPVPKSVYFLDYHDGYEWGVDGFDYRAAIEALSKGQVLVLRRDGVAYDPTRYYVCTANNIPDQGQNHLTFIGGNDGHIEEAMVFEDSRIYFSKLGDTSAIREDVEVLKSRLDSMPFKELTGTSSKPVVIRNLESGIYLVNGKTKMYSTAGVFNSAYDFYIVSNIGTQSWVIKISTSAHSMHRYKITDTANETTSLKFGDILERIGNAESRLNDVENKIPITDIYKERPNMGRYYGEIVRVDPTGNASDNTEVWMYVGYNVSKGSPVWKKIAIEPDN